MTVGGLLISGVAIGRDRWLREAAQFMDDNGGSGAVPTAFLTAFEEAGSGAPADPSQYGFLHLKDARTIAASGVVPSPNSTGMYWRGRISEITGFSFGQLQAS